MTTTQIVDWVCRILGGLVGRPPDTWYFYAEQLKETSNDRATPSPASARASQDARK